MKTIVGLYDSYADAQNAAQELVNAGMDRSDISVVANNETEQYGSRSNATTVGSTDTMADATIHDAEVGAGIGGVLGFLAGASLLVVPGLGFIAGAGWLAGLLTGAAIGGVTGGLVGALTHVGIPEEDAAYYSEGVRRGGTLVAVKAQDADAQRVANVLSQYNAVNIDERSTQYRQDGFLPTPNYTAPTMTTATTYTPVMSNARIHDHTYTGSTMTGTGSTGVVAGAEHVARNAASDVNNTVVGTEGSLPGIQTGGHAVDGSGAPDTRGILEKTADTLTGDRIDDKTGRPV